MTIITREKEKEKEKIRGKYASFMVNETKAQTNDGCREEKKKKKSATRKNPRFSKIYSDSI